MSYGAKTEKVKNTEEEQIHKSNNDTLPTGDDNDNEPYVDDKLIGDDLQIKRAAQAGENKGGASENKSNNY